MTNIIKENLDKIIWIGGSPCSGKSSFAEQMVEKFDLDYYKCDDNLDNYIQRGAQKEIPIMQKISRMDLDETWVNRSVHEMVSDEFIFYKESFQFILEDLEGKLSNNKILVEGAALLPQLMKKERIPYKNYLCMIPTKEFQLDNYSKREWVPEYLKGCIDPDKAFANWMDRDIKFAAIVKEFAIKEGMKLHIEDGSSSLKERFDELLEYWSLFSGVESI